MPFGRGSQSKPISSDAREWRPQAPGTRGARSIKAPIIEPFWDGVHVLAHFDGDAVRFLVDGEDRTDTFPELSEAFAAAAREAGTESIVADAWITNQSADIEIAERLVAGPSTGDVARQMLVGNLGQRPRPPMPEDIDPEKPIYLVLVDLLQVDDEPLLDLPLLERKRLLEGAVLREGGVKITPFAQPPGDTFRTTCRAQGFWAVIYKATNSRYEPGRENADWAVMRLPTS